jgi:hypothetical protein
LTSFLIAQLTGQLKNQEQFKNAQSLAKGTKKDLKFLGKIKKKLEPILESPYFTYFMYALALVAIFFLVRYLLRKRRARNNKVTACTSLNELKFAWKKFFSIIPNEFKLAISHYTPFIVFGSRGSGKTALVNKYLDTDGLSHQFLPSYSKNDTIQLYCGQQVCVQEYNAILLQDSSSAIRAILKKFWKKTLYNNPPVSLFNISIESLVEPDNSELKKQAQLWRGKINILSELSKDAAKIRIALTHMDKIEGYEQFSNLLTANDIQFTININNDKFSSLANCLEPYEKYLSLALTTTESNDYLKLLEFFKTMPSLLNKLSIFLETLNQSDNLSYLPDFDKLYLTSNIDSDLISQPFKGTPCIISTWSKHKHKIGAVALFAVLFHCGYYSYKMEVEAYNNITNSNLKHNIGELAKQIQSMQSHTSNNIDDLLRHHPSNIPFNKDIKTIDQITLDKSSIDFDLANTQKIDDLLINEIDPKMVQKIKNDLGNISPKLSKLQEYVYKYKNLIRDNKPSNLHLPFFILSSTTYDEISREAQQENSSILSKINTRSTNQKNKYQKTVQRLEVAKFRQNTLLPMIRLYQPEQGEIDKKLLFLLTILYSTNQTNDPLAPIVNAHAYQWANLFDDLDYYKINEYVNYNSSLWQQFSIYRMDDILEHKQNIARTIFEKAKKNISKDFRPISNNELETYKEMLKQLASTEKNMPHGWISIFRTLKNHLNTQEGHLHTSPEFPESWELLDHYEYVFNLKNYKLFKKAIEKVHFKLPNCDNMSLTQFLNEVQTYELVTETSDKQDLQSKSKSITALNFLVRDKVEVFDAPAWYNLIKKTELAHFVQKYTSTRDEHGSKIFFEPKDHYADISLTQISNDSFSFSGDGNIPGIYTATAFNDSIKKQLLTYAKFNSDASEKFGLDPKQKSLLNKMITNAVKVYADEYISHLKVFAKAMKVDATSEAQLKYILQQMQKNYTTWGLYLEKLYKNAGISLDSDPIFLPLKNALREFAYIKVLLREDNGNYPELENYLGILQVIESNLNSNAPDNNATLFANEEKSPEDSKFIHLRDELSPTGNMALNIFLNNNDSYYIMLNKWMDSVEIPNAYRKPFLAPVVAIYRIGLTELQNALDKNWGNLVNNSLIPMSIKSPFDIYANQEITPQELQNLIGPQGSIWTTINNHIGPFIYLKDDQWQSTSFTKHLTLPKNMLSTLNRLQAIKNKLWDKSNQPRPVILEASSALLIDADKTMKYFNIVPVLAYLNCGESSILGFNQREKFTKISYEWWNNHNSNVGVQFLNTDDNKQVYSLISVNNKIWSLFKLLTKGKLLDSYTWEWTLNINNALEVSDKEKYSNLINKNLKNTIKVSFSFKEPVEKFFDLGLPKNQSKIVTVRPNYKPFWNKAINEEKLDQLADLASQEEPVIDNDSKTNTTDKNSK